MALMWVFDIRVQFLLLLIFSLLSPLEWGEQCSTNLGNSLLINKLKSFIDSVRANNSSLLCVQYNAAHAWFGALCVIIFREELILINDQPKGDITVAEKFNLCLEEFFILLSCRSSSLQYHIKVAFSATNMNFSFHELDQTLKDIISVCYLPEQLDF